MRDSKPVAFTAGLVVLGSAVLLGYSLSSGFGPRLEAAPFRELGRVLAQQALSHLKPGGVVTVITRDTAAFQNPASDVLLDSFQKELGKSGVKISTLQRLQIDPLRPVSVPTGDFFGWIRNATKGSVIVSFMGPPLLAQNQVAQLGEVKPAIVALCSGPARDQVDLRNLFGQGLLQGAVISKRPVVVKSIPPATDHEAFERLFTEVTSANLAVLSATGNPSP